MIMIPLIVLDLIDFFGPLVFQIILGLILGDACITFPNRPLRPNSNARLEISQGTNNPGGAGFMDYAFAALLPFLTAQFQQMGICVTKFIKCPLPGFFRLFFCTRCAPV
jgi:hypothetical protein